MRLGIHIPISGGLPLVVERGKALGCQTVQIFSRSPRGGKGRVFSNAELALFRQGIAEAGISPLVVHVPYYINLASPQAHIRENGIELLCEDLERAGTLGADYLVTHTGKCLEAGETQGLQWVAEAVTRAVSRVNNRVALLVENMSGAGTEVGYRLAQLAEIVKESDSAKLGICLDTCHAFAAGYNLKDAAAVDKFVLEFDQVVGLDRLRVIHANDSYFPFHCRKDRHMHIGKGYIGLEGFRAMVNHPDLQDLPFILETPEKVPEDDVQNLNTMRSLVKNGNTERIPGLGDKTG